MKILYGEVFGISRKQPIARQAPVFAELMRDKINVRNPCDFGVAVHGFFVGILLDRKILFGVPVPDIKAFERDVFNVVTLDTGHRRRHFDVVGLDVFDRDIFN